MLLQLLCHVAPLTGIAASQFPSSRDAALATHYVAPFISPCFNSLIRYLTYLQRICKYNWRMYCYFLHHWLLEFPMNAVSDCHWEYRPSYTRDFLTPRICNLIKPAAMVKLMQLPAKIQSVMFNRLIKAAAMDIWCHLLKHATEMSFGLRCNIQY